MSRRRSGCTASLQPPVLSKLYSWGWLVKPSSKARDLGACGLFRSASKAGSLGNVGFGLLPALRNFLRSAFLKEKQQWCWAPWGECVLNTKNQESGFSLSRSSRTRKFLNTKRTQCWELGQEGEAGGRG